MRKLTVLFIRGLHAFDGCVSRDVAPFVSLMVMIAALLSLVFCKMEVRRMGYSILQLTRVERQMRDRERVQLVQLAKITRPGRVQAVAEHRLTLRRAGAGQIIQMTEQGVVFRE